MQIEQKLKISAYEMASKTVEIAVVLSCRIDRPKGIRFFRGKYRFSV